MSIICNLDTPDLAGRLTTSGYVVLGLGSKSYAGDKLYGYYYENPTKVSNTILTSNNRIDQQIDVGRLLALSVETMVDCKKDGNTYTFKSGKLPALVANTAYYLVADYVQDNYYLDMFGLYDYGYMYDDGNNTQVRDEDWEQLVKNQYASIYKEELPNLSDVYDDDVLYGRYMVAVNAATQIENEARSGYDSGLVYVKADGTHEWYATEEEWMLKVGKLELYYADWTKAFKNYHKIVTGEEITDRTIDYVTYSPNPELWDAYNSFNADMQAYYTEQAKQQDPEALGAIVLEDGSIKTFNYIVSNNLTTTQRIFDSLKFAQLSNLDAAVTVDGEGRLTGFAGSVEIEVTDGADKVHLLKIDFDCKAEDYGTTSVPETFVPADYDLISFDEYQAKYEAQAEEGTSEFMDEFEKLVSEDPGTIEFLGNVYETQMSMYDFSDEEANG